MILVYIKRGKKTKEIIQKLNSLNLNYIVDLSKFKLHKSPYIHATELEEIFGNPHSLILPNIENVDEFERYVYLADFINAERLVLRPPPTLDALRELYETSAKYGIEINWLFGEPPLARPADVEEIAKSIHPRAAKISYDPIRARNMREIFRNIVGMSGYVREIYFSNRRGKRGPRLPPFNPLGEINYVEILQALILIQWEGIITIRQSPEYVEELDLQLRMMSEITNSAKNAGVSKKVGKMVAQILDELFS